MQRKYLKILSSKANISEARLSCSFLCTHCFRFRTVSPTLTLLAARGFLAPPFFVSFTRRSSSKWHCFPYNNIVKPISKGQDPKSKITPFVKKCTRILSASSEVTGRMVNRVQIRKKPGGEAGDLCDKNVTGSAVTSASSCLCSCPAQLIVLHHWVRLLTPAVPLYTWVLWRINRPGHVILRKPVTLFNSRIKYSVRSGME